MEIRIRDTYVAKKAVIAAMKNSDYDISDWGNSTLDGLADLIMAALAAYEATSKYMPNGGRGNDEDHG